MKILVNIYADYNKYDMSKREYIFVFIASVVLDFVIFYLFYRSIYVCIVMAAPTYLIFIGNYKKYRIDKRKWELLCGFEEMLGCVANALRTGYSFENSFYEAKKELAVLYGKEKDIICEIDIICSRLKLNCTIESILNDLAKRSGIDEVNNFVQIIMVAKRSGGDIISIVKQTADSMHDKKEVEDEIRTLVAGKRLEYRIMSVMPVGMLVYFGICSPKYLGILYENIIGRVVMTVCLFIYAASYYIAKKIMSFDDTVNGKHILSGAGVLNVLKRKSKKYNEAGFCALYRRFINSRFKAGMNKVSKKVAKVYMDIPAEKACIRFWNKWFLCVKTCIVSAIALVVFSFLFARDSALYVCIIAVAAVIAIPYGRLKELDKKLNYRNEQMIMDYPEIIRRFSLLIGAGSSMCGAWERIVNDYMKKRKNNSADFRYIYEEMRFSLYELKNGVSEAAVYEEFGQRIRLIPYMKLGSIFTHNLRKGNSYILKQLDMSSLDAYGQRRENIKRMGEEASSKLLLPIMLQFVLVLIIIMYPAVMSL